MAKSPELSDTEMKILAYSWQCFKSGPPDIDYEKLSKFTGHSNPKSTSNAMANIKKKLAAMTMPSNDKDPSGSDNSPPPVTPKKDAPKATKTPKTPKSPKSSTGKKRKSTEVTGNDDGVKVKDEEVGSADAAKKSADDTKTNGAAKDDAAGTEETAKTKPKATPKSKASPRSESPSKDNANSPTAAATANPEAGNASPTAAKKPRGRPPTKKAKTDAGIPQTDGAADHVGAAKVAGNGDGKDEVEEKVTATTRGNADNEMTDKDGEDELATGAPFVDAPTGTVEVAV